MSFYPVLLLLGCVVYATAFPEPDPVWHSNDSPRVIRPAYNPNNPPRVIRPIYNPNNPPRVIHPIYRPNDPPKFIRVRRFTDRANRFDGQNPQQQKRPEWEVKPDLSRDQRGNTQGQVTVQKHGENHDFEAGWGQTIRGPDKHSETWHAGGSISPRVVKNSKMLLYWTILLANVVLCITAFPHQDQPAVNFDQPISELSHSEETEDDQIISLRRLSERQSNNFNLNDHQRQRRSNDWELKGNAVRDKFGNIGGQVSLDKHGKNYDVSGQVKQNFGGRGRHGDRTWVGVNGQIRF